VVDLVREFSTVAVMFLEKFQRLAFDLVEMACLVGRDGFAPVRSKRKNSLLYPVISIQQLWADGCSLDDQLAETILYNSDLFTSRISIVFVRGGMHTRHVNHGMPLATSVRCCENTTGVCFDSA